MSGEGDREHRLRAQVVNVGLVAVAAAQELPRDEPIALRCECGRKGCGERIRVSPAEYAERAAGFSRLFLAVGHETGRGTLLERTPRFLLVDAEARPFAAEPRPSGRESGRGATA